MTPPVGRLRVLFSILMAAVTSACSVVSQPSLEALHHSTVLVEHARGHGTGVIIGPNRILTADHVIESDPLDVTFFNGETAPGRVRWRDPKLDLAVLEVEVPDRYPVSRIQCGELQPGQHLMLVAHPTHSRWKLAGGYLEDGHPYEGNLVLLGFPIGLGSSGGPVFDEEGEIVGVALAILAERSSESATYGSQYKDTGLGLMLPAHVFCDDLAVE